MKAWVFAPIALQILAGPAAATEICLEFLNEQLDSPEYETACIHSMEALSGDPETSAFGAFAPSGQSMAMGAGNPFPFVLRNINMSDPDRDGPMLGDPDSQNEIFVALDANSDQVFAISKNETPPPGETQTFQSSWSARSSDGGKTWTETILFKDLANAPGEVARSVGDPWAVFDGTGKLYVSYLTRDRQNEPQPLDSPTEVVVSSDGGATFNHVASLGLPAPIGSPPEVPDHATDKGVMAWGEGSTRGGATADSSLWVFFIRNNSVPRELWVQGAAIDSNGNIIENFCGSGVGDKFCPPEKLDISGASPSFNVHRTGTIVLGPNGEVLVAYWVSDLITSEIFVQIDPDGLGPLGFSDPSSVMAVPPQAPIFTTNLAVELITANGQRSAIPTPDIDWDLDTSRFPPIGRPYLVFTSEDPQVADDTDVQASYATIDPVTMLWSWAPAVRVNDDKPDPPAQPGPGETFAQFFPDIAVDQFTGHVAIAWQDARNSTANDQTDLFMAFSTDDGNQYGPNIRVSDGQSTPDPNDLENTHGDYLGLAFRDGIAHPVWVDNSNIKMDNADTPAEMDPFTARVAFDIHVDSDNDTVPDLFDNCLTLPNAPPLDCDTDLDGYGNACDGDFNNSNGTDATDFSDYFLPDFAPPGIDSGTGTDMNCNDGNTGVDATDFSNFFLPQFTGSGEPGPSGLPCAGTGTPLDPCLP